MEEHLEGLELFDAADARVDAETRPIIDQLIADTKLYSSRESMKELLAFMVKLRHIAPFNAMLLHIQKPGLSHAMTAKDWWDRFKRAPKRHARPLVVLRTFGPVDFVYDILDTDGPPLPEAAFSFPTSGTIPNGWFSQAETKVIRESVELCWHDWGDQKAGYAKMTKDRKNSKQLNSFEVGINRNHSAPVKFVTLLHELAHIYLGHCGADKKRGVGFRGGRSLDLREVEAETVAYVVAKRSGMSPRSESYLDRYQGAFEELDLHTVMKVVNKIERLLKLPLGVKDLWS